MSEGTDYILWVQKGDGTLQEIPLTNITVVGRGQSCDLKIEDEVFGDQHFRITITIDNIILEVLTQEGSVKYKDQVLGQNASMTVQEDEAFMVGDYRFFIRKSEPASFMELHGLKQEERTSGVSPSTNLEPRINQLKEEFFQKGKWKIFILVFVGVFILAMIGSWFLWINPTLQSKTSTPLISSATSVAIVETTPAQLIISQTPIKEATPSLSVDLLPTSSVEVSSITITPPGLGMIDFSSFSISPESINISQMLNLQLSLTEVLNLALEIAGENIGFVYQYSGINENGKLRTIELKYIKSEYEKVVDGVTYPEWGDEPIPIEINWKPNETYIQDDSGSYPALVVEPSYKATDDAAVFSTTGLYVFKESGDRLYSLMYFDKDGQMLKVVVFNSTDGIAGLPREVTPTRGDQFIILLRDFQFEKKMEGTAELAEAEGIKIPPALQIIINQYGNEFLPVVYGKGRFVEYEGKTITFGESKITLRQMEGITGDYMVGVAVEDMDGNFYIAYIPVEVVEKYVSP